MVSWANNSYAFRRELSLSSVDGAPVGQFVQFYLADTSKVRRDYNDVVIIYSDLTQATPIFQPLGRVVTTTALQKLPEIATGLIVEFQLVHPMVIGEVNIGNYMVYYGNLDLVNPIINPVYISNPWPNSVANDGVGLSYTRPGEHWIKGISSTVGAMAYFNFWGTKVQMISQLGLDQGIASVQMDGGMWTDVDLYSTSTADGIVYESDYLAPGKHVLTVQVTGRKSGGSSGTSINIMSFNYVKYIETIGLGEEVASLGLMTSLGG